MRDNAAPLPHIFRARLTCDLKVEMRRALIELRVAALSSPIGAMRAFLCSSATRSRQRFVAEPDSSGSTLDEPPPTVDSSAAPG